MASLLWGKVYYKDTFAGILKEEPGDCTSFEYDDSYLESKNPAISYTLPLTSKRHISLDGLLPFFDNLVAEGWLEQAQSRLLNKRRVSRFELLLAFGYDCAGAVWVVDTSPSTLSQALLDLEDSKEMALLKSRASLSGVQPKLAVVEREGKFYPTSFGELSTYIAKFPSPSHLDLTINEYLTTLAFKALLPEDEVASMSLSSVEGIDENALLVKRFDRSSAGRLHFEEFNQLLNKKSSLKYESSHKDMSSFILGTKECLPVENYRLFARILAGFLLGNTDMHLKNFAMFHTQNGLRLTPCYDLVCAYLYNYKTVALGIGGAKDLSLGLLKPKNLIVLAEEFSLPTAVLLMLFKQFKRMKEKAKEVIFQAPLGTCSKQYILLKNQLINQLEARWNATFDLIGLTLSKKS